MIINEDEWTLSGMSDEVGLEQNYRDGYGNLNKYYLKGINDITENYAKEFEIALKAFYYNFPKEGQYKISWRIERLDNDNK